MILRAEKDALVKRATEFDQAAGKIVYSSKFIVKEVKRCHPALVAHVW